MALEVLTGFVHSHADHGQHDERRKGEHFASHRSAAGVTAQQDGFERIHV
jgi:hypothetical protein